MEAWGHVFLLLVACVGLAASQDISIAKMLKGLDVYQESYPLPTLPYKYDALEPYIDQHTLKEHHLGVHAKHTLNMNKVLKEWRASVR